MSTAGASRERSRAKIRLDLRLATWSSLGGLRPDHGGHLDRSLAEIFLSGRHCVGCRHYVAAAYHMESAGARSDRPGAIALDRMGRSDTCGLAVYMADREHTLHRLHGPTPLLSHVWGYLIWAVTQQFLLQIYFLLRLQRMLPGSVAPVVAAAGLFALAHLPNPVLTPVTLVWGIAACLLVFALSEYLCSGDRPRNPGALCRSDCARTATTPYEGGDRLLPVPCA